MAIHGANGADKMPANGSTGGPGGEQGAGKRDRALAALERMGKPQPKPVGAVPQSSSPPLPEHTMAVGSGSATGFVGTLARDALAAGELPGPPAAEQAGPERSVRMHLPMAREIRPMRPAHPPAPAAPPPRAADSSARPPASSRIGAALMAVFAVVLAAIGFWAAGALIYMARIRPMSPADVHYPLLSWTYDLGAVGDYTAATRMVAWTMLICLPVAAVMLVLAIRIGRKKA